MEAMSPMRISSTVILLTAVLSLVACTAPKKHYTTYVKTPASLESDSSIGLTLIPEHEVNFAAYLDYEDNSTNGSVMYPGGHAAVFVASVFMHSIAASSSHAAAQKSRQKEADRILMPYRGVIESIEISGLMQSAQEQLQFSASDEGNDYLLKVSPLFLFKRDQKALMLKNVVALYDAEEENRVVYRNIVEVISEPVSKEVLEALLVVEGQSAEESSSEVEQVFIGSFEGEPEVKEAPKRDAVVDYWINDEDNRLRVLTKHMLLKSLEVALSDMRGSYSEAELEKTFKFYFGEEKKYERGKLATKNEDWVVIRTLRGWLKAYPVSVSI